MTLDKGGNVFCTEYAAFQLQDVLAIQQAPLLSKSLRHFSMITEYNSLAIDLCAVVSANFFSFIDIFTRYVF